MNERHHVRHGETFNTCLLCSRTIFNDKCDCTRHDPDTLAAFALRDLQESMNRYYKVRHGKEVNREVVIEIIAKNLAATNALQREQIARMEREFNDLDTRLRLAREALISHGGFLRSEIGSDLAPRIIEALTRNPKQS